MDFREFSRSHGVQDRQIDRQIDRWKDLREFGADRQNSGDSEQIEKLIEREISRNLGQTDGSQEVQDRQREESQGIWDRQDISGSGQTDGRISGSLGQTDREVSEG